jgi:hypothetical protein
VCGYNVNGFLYGSVAELSGGINRCCFSSLEKKNTYRIWAGNPELKVPVRISRKLDANIKMYIRGMRFEDMN